MWKRGGRGLENSGTGDISKKKPESDRPGRHTEQPAHQAFSGGKKFSDSERVKAKGPENHTDYSRPSGYRKGMRDQVWENAKDAHGRVRDPVSGKYMSKEKPWDMGHRPGYEFAKHQESAKERGISRKEFLDEHNNPDHFRPELPSSNRSHKGEDKTSAYFGD